MAAKDIATAAFAAARLAQFAPAVDGVDLWIWSSPRSPDLDAVLALAVKAGGDAVLASIRPERLGLRFTVGEVMHVIPWATLNRAAFGQVAGLLELRAAVVEEHIREAAIEVSRSSQPEPEANDGRTIH